jgi:hypothetical protein
MQLVRRRNPSFRGRPRAINRAHSSKKVDAFKSIRAWTPLELREPVSDGGLSNFLQFDAS